MMHQRRRLSMSIRPIAMEDIGETSFEDVESTFTYKDELEVPQLVPNSATSTTTENTTFSKDKRYSSHTDLASDEVEGINYNSDFEEYQQGHDMPLNVDARFRENSEQDELQELQEQLEKKLSMNLRNSYKNIGMSKSSSGNNLRQPKSMMDLSSRRGGGETSGAGHRRIPSSRSYMTLRPKSRKDLSYKASMPSLMRYSHEDAFLEEEDQLDKYMPRQRAAFNKIEIDFSDEEDEDENENYNENFGNDFVGIDDTFQFDEKLIHPRLFNNRKKSFDPTLRFSPSQYDIEHDDTLLTPQLHKKHHDFNVPLDSYREKWRNSASGNRRPISRRDSTRVAARLKTIKQEIDHNTPMKRGKMRYNPNEKRWDGNEDILRNFENIDNVDRKAFLIKNKRSSSPMNKASSSTARTTNSQHGKIVGNMKFDERNLRWLRVEGPEEDPFLGINDLLPRSQSSPTKNVKFQMQSDPQPHSTLRSQSQLPFVRDERGNRFTSSDSTRFHSLTTVPTTDPTFQITSKQLERFYHEENKWSRKVGGWFILGEKNRDDNSPDASMTNVNDKGYMYEIRNMVISSAHN